MATNILVPELGESVLEATVSRWLKKEGDAVNAGDILVELETDKVNLEVSAKSAGVIARIDAAEGQDVRVGDVLGAIDEQAKKPETPAAPTPAAKPEAAQAKPEPKPEPTAPRKENGSQPERQAPQLTPVASRMVQENNIDASQLSGTGIEGRVTRTDVEQFMRAHEKSAAKQELKAETPEPAPAEKPAAASTAAAASAPAVPAGGRPEERTRMSRRRRTIAERLLEAQQSTAMLSTFNEIDMGAVMELRKRRNDEFQARHGVKLGFTSFFVKATISALKAFPPLNAEIQGEEIVLKHYFDMGVAVGSAEGLVVPVLRNADRLSFAQIEQQVKDLVAKTEQGKLSIDDLRGGTFTITNGGVFGSLLSTPILNQPQVGILGLHKIQDRPVALNGQVVIRPMMYVALTYDHRIVDGREAVQFLVHIKQMIEDPGYLLLEE